MLDLIAAAGIGGIIGFGTCAVLTMGKLADQHEWSAIAAREADDKAEAEAAHTRCADALSCAQRKLSSIRDLVGPTEGLRRGRLGQIAAILDGERV